MPPEILMQCREFRRRAGAVPDVSPSPSLGFPVAGCILGQTTVVPLHQPRSNALIFLIRHGQTEWNREARLQGRKDSPLTGEGIAQARRMGEVLQKAAAEAGPWIVMSSPLGRAYDTARIVCETAGLTVPIATDDRLAELSVGPFEGMTRDEILAHTPQTEITPGWIYNIPGGETEAELRARLADWLAEVDETDGHRRLVVSHGIAGRMLRHLYAGEPLQGLPPPQDSVFRLRGGRIEHLDG